MIGTIVGPCCPTEARFVCRYANQWHKHLITVLYYQMVVSYIQGMLLFYHLEGI